MSIKSLLSGLAPRTKAVKISDNKTVTLHEFSTIARMRIEEERQALAEKTDATTRDYNESAAKVVAMSMLGIDSDPSQDDIEAVLELLGLDQLDGLYVEALKFNGLDNDAQEEAKKN